MITKKEMKNISLEEKEINKPKVKETFCEYWPTTKEGLLLFQRVVKNPIVKFIVGIVITVGDNIKLTFCK
jgi:hypothetical protein